MNPDDGQLDRLAETIERLRARIEQHGDHIGGHETRTRVILIDPLLRSLGWDTEDPEMVVHEHRAGSWKLDYALLCEGEVVGIVEAKAFGSKLNDEAWGKYAAEHRDVPVIAFTNGDEWRFFRRSNNWTRESVTVSIGESFRAGWGINQKIGRDVVQLPEPPIKDDREREIKPTKILEPVGPNDGDLDWRPLTEVRPSDQKGGRKPIAIRFPSGPVTAVSSWSKVHALTAGYVVDNRFLNGDDFPVILANRRPVRKYAMHTSPVHPSGKKFYAPVQVGQGVWLENGLGRDSMRWLYSIRLLERFGIDASTVKVAFD